MLTFFGRQDLDVNSLLNALLKQSEGGEDIDVACQNMVASVVGKQAYTLHRLRSDTKLIASGLFRESNPVSSVSHSIACIGSNEDKAPTCANVSQRLNAVQDSNDYVRFVWDE